MCILVPILVLVSIALQIACAVHAVRSGRTQPWLWLLFIGSYLAVIVYVIAAVIPDLRNDPRGRAVARNVLHKIDPERQKRVIAQKLELSGTVENRRALAMECLRLRDYVNAADLFRGCLSGIYADDPQFMLGLAQAQAGQRDFAATRATLENLIKSNPDFRSSDGHLLYARSLDELGEADAALNEYAILATSYPGEEARYRYGALLKKRERFLEARDVFQEMLKREKVAPKYYRRKESEWLDAAKRDLAAMGPV